MTLDSHGVAWMEIIRARFVLVRRRLHFGLVHHLCSRPRPDETKLVIAMSEANEAIQCGASALDCFPSLAMTDLP